MRGLIFCLLLVGALPAFAADVKTAGFVQGLWYDRAEIFADETVRLYVAIRNNTGSDLTGKVEFKDNGKMIGSASASALDNRIIESWVDWTPDYGDHTITANLSRVELSSVGTTTRHVAVMEGSTEQSIFVDYDTDKDGVGNQKDTDDDGDDIKDEADDEPLIFNEPDNNNNNDEEDEDDETDDEDDSNDSNSNNDNDDEPLGLERFLDKNRADSILTGMTNLITKTKTNLDEYREERNGEIENNDSETVDETALASEASQSSGTTTSSSNSNFGEVTRTQSESGSWVGKIFGLIKDFISKVYTFILFIISVYLGHPALVQLTLLFLIIFIIFKLAKRLAGRPY